MLKELLKDIKPAIDFIYGLIDENENLEKDLSEVRAIGRKYQEEINELSLQINKLKQENHAMQLFIEEHVPEEKKKLIFKN